MDFAGEPFPILFFWDLLSYGSSRLDSFLALVGCRIFTRRYVWSDSYCNGDFLCPRHHGLSGIRALLFAQHFLYGTAFLRRS